MTNSMIPYSFIPGTKAKAGEVNANFIALADAIDANKTTASNDIEDIKELLNTKANKTELINEHTVTESDTDLNDYKTKGTYIFSSVYTPTNIPTGTDGMLVVTGNEDSVIKQIWFCAGDNPEIYTRNLIDTEWQEWQSIYGETLKEQTGYLNLPNGLIIQWGSQVGSIIVYPIAYSKLACPIFAKNGFAASTERSDTGLTEQSLTGFIMTSGGVFWSMNWIAIGY